MNKEESLEMSSPLNDINQYFNQKTDIERVTFNCKHPILLSKKLHKNILDTSERFKSEISPRNIILNK